MKTAFLNQIKKDFPEFNFKPGDKFAFRPPKTILVGPEESEDKLLLLHELGHAILEHRDFTIDVERLKMEAAAWEKAKDLAKKYKIPYNEEEIQAELDTYRNWLHKKSRCPECGLTRFQDDSGYHCPRCENLV